MKPEDEIRRSIRRWLLFFISALILSGITAFALEQAEVITVEEWSGL